MTPQEIEKKHTSLVTGGYAKMLPASRIKYHVQTTVEAVIEELVEWKLMIRGRDHISYAGEILDMLEKLAEHRKNRDNG